jgi:carbon-monoxide dehydrogenase medium subunit
VILIDSFFLHQPNTLDDALNLLAENPDQVRILAGGTELILLLKMGLATTKHIVNIKKLPGLGRLEYDAASNTLRIGALVTHRELEKSDLVKRHHSLIVHMEKSLANVRIRNIGTLAGNLSFAEPHADPGTLLLAHDAVLKVNRAGAERRVNIADFFIDYYETALRGDELLTEIEIPAPQNSTGTYVRFCPGERPMAGVAVILGWNNDVCASARLALGCVGPTPIRVGDSEQWMIGKSRDDIVAAAKHLGETAAGCSQPLEDVWGTVEYKKQIVKTLVARAISDVAQRTATYE